MDIKYNDYNIEIKKALNDIKLFIKPFDFDYDNLDFKPENVINRVLLDYVAINSRLNIYSVEGRNQLKNQFDNKLDYLRDNYELNKNAIKKYSLLSDMCILESRFYKIPF